MTLRQLDGEVFEAGESPVWDERSQRLYWIDNKANRVHLFDTLRSQRHTWPWPETPGCCGLDQNGHLIVSDKKGLWRLSGPDAPPLRFLDFQLPDHHRPNDGKPGPDGAFWMSVMDERPERAPTGYLMRVAPDAAGVSRHVTGLRTGNGLDWSPDGKRLYLSDSRGEWIDSWAFDIRTAVLSDRRRFFTANAQTGRPDGAAVDTEGGYWFAGIGAGKLNRVSSSGKLLFSLTLPFRDPSMPCFAGADLATVVVTSLKGNDPSPWAGTLYHTQFSVKGVPARRFISPELR